MEDFDQSFTMEMEGLFWGVRFGARGVVGWWAFSCLEVLVEFTEPTECGTSLILGHFVESPLDRARIF